MKTGESFTYPSVHAASRSEYDFKRESIMMVLRGATLSHKGFTFTSSTPVPPMREGSNYHRIAALRNKGLKCEQIAEQLGLTYHTVATMTSKAIGMGLCERIVGVKGTGRKYRQKGLDKRSVAVIATSIATGETFEYVSINSACADGFARQAIADTISGISTQHAGFRWEAKDPTKANGPTPAIKRVAELRNQGVSNPQIMEVTGYSYNYMNSLISRAIKFGLCKRLTKWSK